MQPTVGRIVHFFPAPGDTIASSNGNTGPVAAIVARVWTPEMVNLTIFPDNGTPATRSSIGRRGSPVDQGWGAWDWPPRAEEATPPESSSGPTA